MRLFLALSYSVIIAFYGLFILLGIHTLRIGWKRGEILPVIAGLAGAGIGLGYIVAVMRTVVHL